jgi:hypothetical protein
MSVACALSFCLTSAEAKLVPIAITAEVTRVQDDRGLLEGRVNIGDLITGVYIYDSSTPDTYDPSVLPGYPPPAPAKGIYEHTAPPYGMTLTVGGFVFMTDPEDVDFIITINSSGSYLSSDEYVVASYNNLPLSNGVRTGKIVLRASGDYTVLPSDALPTTAPDLDRWNTVVVLCWGAAGEEDYYFRADVTSAVLIPEPATMILLSLGALVLLRKRKFCSG